MGDFYGTGIFWFSVTHVILKFTIVRKKFQQTNKTKINHINDNHIKFEVSLHFWGIWPTVRRASSFAFEQSLFCKKKVTNAEYKLPQKWRHYHKGSRQRKEGWCIFPRILAIYQKSETYFPYQIELLFCSFIFAFFCSGSSGFFQLLQVQLSMEMSFLNFLIDCKNSTWAYSHASATFIQPQGFKVPT